MTENIDRYFIYERETHRILTECQSIERAYKIIEKYEKKDLAIGMYDIIDWNGKSFTTGEVYEK